MAVRVFIPEEFIQLHLEIQHHPLLFQRLQKHPADSGPEIVLAEIAAYCSIAVDGEFTEDDLKILAGRCLDILKRSRPKPAIYTPEDDWSKVYESELKRKRDKK